MSDEQKQQNYTSIIHRLRDVRNRGQRALLARGSLLSLAAALLVLLLAFGVEAVFHLSIEGRTILFIAAAVAVLAAVAVWLLPPLLPFLFASRRKSDDAVAFEVGQHFPDVKDRLLNVLQVEREMRSSSHAAYSMSLVDASFSRIAKSFAGLNLQPVIDTTPLRRALKFSLYSFALFAAVSILLPSTMFDAAGRVFSFRTDYAPPAPFEFLVEPGDTEAIKGRQLTLRASTTAILLPPDVTFYLSEDGQEGFDAVVTERDSSGGFTHTISGIRSSLVYYAEADGYRSRQYRIDVVDRPFVRTMRLKLNYPAYTRLSPKYLDDNVGDVTALAGTRVSMDLAFNKEVQSAVLVFSDSLTVQLDIDGESARGAFTLRRNGTYRIELLDPGDIGNASPISYNLNVLPDLHPVVDILEPGKNMDVDERMRLIMLMDISDDYGFSALKLHYRLAASRYEMPHEEYSSILLPLPSLRDLELEVPYIWNLSELSLVPEDVVSYYVEVFDNDIVNGPKSGRSPMFMLRLPSMEEVFAKADSEQQKAVEDLTETLKSAEEVQKELDALQKELKQQNAEEMDWQQKKKLEELMKRQEELIKDVEKVNEQISELKEEMDQQNLISEETLKKYQELEQLMREVDAPEIREAMKRMQENMEQMSPEQMKEALENFTFNEEAFKKSIERTIELLKRIQIEQKVDELTRRSEDLADRQEDLAERTENADPENQDDLDKLAEEQREMQKQMEAMQREMAELQKMMEQFPKEMPLSEMQEAMNEMSLSEMQQQMSSCASMCQGGQCKGASKKQKQSAQQMRRLQKKMEQVKKKLDENMQRMVQRAFQKALNQILDLSKRQEALKNEIATLPPNSQRFTEATREQMRMAEQLNMTANDLMELGKKTFAVDQKMGEHIGKAMQQMKQATRSMQNRDKKSGGSQQGGAMAELNETAKQIANGMRSNKSGGSSGGSMMRQLQRMAQQQMNINQQTGKMPGQQQQPGGQRLQRLMAQQQAMQKSLQELNEEAKRSEDGKRLLGDLDRIAEEMQEVVRDMQQNNINPNTLRKQERILSRLLDASRSMRERDWEKKRRSRSGSDITRRSPDQLNPDLLDAEEVLRSDLQKAMDEGYSRDYELLIRRYFDSLQKELSGGDDGVLTE